MLGQSLVTQVTMTRGEAIARRLRPEQAESTRDGAAKALYGRLFAWIVTRINNVLAPETASEVLEVGVLDIFGFENFEVNSFEQLCINVANEQLQYYFNQHVFAWELEELRNEGIKVDNISFENNKPIIDMFLQRPMGFLAILDEESFYPRASDESLAEKLAANLRKQKQYFEPSRRLEDLKFTVTHFAARVTYSLENFLEKNRDLLSPTIERAFLDSGVPLIRMLFKHDVGPTGIMGDWQDDLDRTKTATVLRTLTPNTFRGKMRRDSVRSTDSHDSLRGTHRSNSSSGLAMHPNAGLMRSGSGKGTLRGSRKSRGRRRSRLLLPQVKAGPSSGGARKKATIASHFKASLADLMTKMMAAQPHFIRCIKPNKRQVADVFDEDMVLRQLRYTGVMQTIRIRRMGYPVRLDFGEFVRRYQILAFALSKDITDADAPAACVKVLSSPAVQAGIARAAGDAAAAGGSPPWELGKTKVFLKYFVVDVLGHCLEFHHRRAVLLQARVRGQAARRYVKRLRIEIREREEAERRAREEAERRAREEAERRAEEERQRRERELQEQREREEREAAAKREREKKKAAVAAAREKERAAALALMEQEAERRAANARKPAALAHTTTAAPASGRLRSTGEPVSTHEMTVEPFFVGEYDSIDLNLIKKNRIPTGTAHLNRYMNILPNPRTRVRLAQLGNDPTTTYINANHIRGWDNTPGRYLASQGPTAQTMADFWRMVWEADARAIVMVTGLKERGKEKCARYWPKVLYNDELDLGDMQLGYINIAVMAGFKANGYITTKLRLRKDGVAEERIVMHYWYNSWPDHGVPADEANVYHMLQTVREWSDSPAHPWVVHCSAGVGRTGTFITIDHGIQQLEATGRTNVNDIIRNLRRDRCAMVQHAEQAEFAHRVLVRYAEDRGAVPEPIVDEKDDSILARSLRKAERCVPSTFDVHGSQLDADEGAPDAVPSWRQELIKRREEEEREEILELEMQDDVGRRRAQRMRQRLRKKEEARQQAEERLRHLERGDLQALGEELGVPLADHVAQAIRLKREQGVLEELAEPQALDSDSDSDAGSDGDDFESVAGLDLPAGANAGGRPAVSPIPDEDEATERGRRGEARRTVSFGGASGSGGDTYELPPEEDYLLELEKQAELFVAASGGLDDRSQYEKRLRRQSYKLSANLDGPVMSPEVDRYEVDAIHARVRDSLRRSLRVARLPRQDGDEWRFKPPLTWKTRHVKDWLLSLDPDYAEAAQQLEVAEINGAHLMDLNDAKMKKLGVKSARLRREVRAALKQLRLATKNGLVPLQDGAASTAGSPTKGGGGDSGSPLARRATGTGAAREGDVDSSASALDRLPPGALEPAAPPPAKEVYVAIASFPGDRATGKLRFEEGQTMAFLQEVTADWFEVRLDNGTVGLVPSNYIQQVGLNAAGAESALGSPVAAKAAPAMAKGSESPRFGWGRTKSKGQASSAAAAAARAAAEVANARDMRPEMEAIADVPGRGPGEVPLLVGDEVKVDRENADGTMDIQKTNGARGTVPGRYLKDIMPTAQLRVITEKRDHGSVVLPEGTLVTRVCRVSATEYLVRDPRSGSEHRVPAQSLETYDASVGDNVLVQASERYTGGPGKLPLVAGEKMRLLRRLTSDWLEVRKQNSGACGFVPSHAVQMLDEPSKEYLQAIAAYDPAGRHGHLPLAVAERVTMVRGVNAEWCIVENSRNQRGIVPKSYVQSASAAGAIGIDTANGDVMDRSVMAGAAATNGDEDAPEDGVVRVLADYAPSDARSLPLQEGEPLTVLQQPSEDWLIVRRADGMEGLAPATYVTPGRALYRAVADYPGDPGSGQLAMHADEVFVLLSFQSGEWILARAADGREGLIPTTYTELLDDAAVEAAKALNQSEELQLPGSRTSIQPAEGSVATAALLLRQEAAQKSQPQRSLRPVSSINGPSVRQRTEVYKRSALEPAEWTKAHVRSWLHEQLAPSLAAKTAALNLDGRGLLAVTAGDLEGAGLYAPWVDHLLKAIADLESGPAGVGKFGGGAQPRKGGGLAPQNLSLNRSRRVQNALLTSMRNPEGNMLSPRLKHKPIAPIQEAPTPEDLRPKAPPPPMPAPLPPGPVLLPEALPPPPPPFWEDVKPSPRRQPEAGSLAAQMAAGKDGRVAGRSARRAEAKASSSRLREMEERKRSHDDLDLPSTGPVGTGLGLGSEDMRLRSKSELPSRTPRKSIDDAAEATPRGKKTPGKKNKSKGLLGKLVSPRAKPRTPEAKAATTALNAQMRQMELRGDSPRKKLLKQSKKDYALRMAMTSQRQAEAEAEMAEAEMGEEMGEEGYDQYDGAY